MVTPELPEQFEFEFDQEPPNPHSKSTRDDLKVEPPLLCSNLKLDMFHCERPPPPDLKKLSTMIRLSPQREEDDRGFECEAKVLDKVEHRKKAIETEKLEIMEEACCFLQTVLREHCDSADEEEFAASDLHSPRSKRFREAPYLLRPDTLSPIPFEPPPTVHMNLISEGPHLQDLRVSNVQLAKHDSIHSLDRTTGDMMPTINTEELGLAEDDGQDSEMAEWNHKVGCSRFVRFLFTNPAAGHTYSSHRSE